jgi:hypothetical protein
MSIKAIDLKQTESAEWEFEMEDGSNKVTGKLVYGDLFENWLTRVPKFGSAHPDIPSLLMKKFKGKREEGGMIRVTLDYENNNPDLTYPNREKGPIKRYHMEPGAGEEPLLTHKIFKTLTEKEQEAAQELLASGKTSADFTKATAVLTSEAGVKAIEKIRRGQEAYRWPSLVWVEKFTTNKLADIELHKILKTTSNPPGDCPSAGDDRNWLRLPPSVTPHDDGKNWDIENRWELSLEGKWDTDFYKAGG